MTHKMKEKRQNREWSGSRPTQLAYFPSYYSPSLFSFVFLIFNNNVAAMEEGSSRGSKRPFIDEDDSNKAPSQKRVRFPKGKKVKQGDFVIDGREDVPSGWRDPRLAAKERTVRRNQITAELLDEENEGEIADISRAEVEYGENETFIDDGIAIEPFNLDKEREEGYFDASGNYVEYLNENQIKDAWLDSVDTEKRYAGKKPIKIANEDEIQDLSSEELGKMKRRIADALEPGETVLQALRRMKGTSNNKKIKMTAETKQMFDQLTEDAMKLMENGDYNVYDEKQESFQREAEGYEKLAQARGKSIEPILPKPESILDEDFLPSGSTATVGEHPTHSADVASSNSHNSASKNDDAFDMFGEDDESTPANPASNGGDQHGDYVFDESSGYYYSSSLGYYYDPASGLYCHAGSGQWYSYNNESGIYEEVPQATPDAS